MNRLERAEKLPMWIVGVITPYGEIRARACTSGSSHHTDEERLSGRIWRWSPWSQDFGPVLIGSQQLERDDYFVVCDWLESMGYKEPEEEG